MAAEPVQPIDRCGDIHVQLVYAQGTADTWRAHIALPARATIAQALSLSGFEQQFPALDPNTLKIGIYGQRCSPDHALSDGDRIEIYRSLDFDPMESRRRRAQHRKERMSRT